MIDWIIEHLFPVGIVSAILASQLIVFIQKCPIRYRLLVRRLARESFDKIATEIESDEINFRYEEIVSKLLRAMSYKLKKSDIDIPLEKQVKVNQRMRVVAETLAGKLDVNRLQYEELTKKQTLYVKFRKKGMEPLAAAEAAGYSHPSRALSRLGQNKKVQTALRKKK